jgi:hypothetical protein
VVFTEVVMLNGITFGQSKRNFAQIGQEMWEVRVEIRTLR